MKYKATTHTICFLAAITLFVGAAEIFAQSASKVDTLENGLELILVENHGSPAPFSVLCRLTSSRCRLRFVHRSFTFRSYTGLQSFRENKKPCLLCGKQGLEKSYGSSVTCLPPGYPNSFRGLALYTTWIGQG